jgi:hypothetical protein
MQPHLKFTITAFILALSFGAGLTMSGKTSVPLATSFFVISAGALTYIVWGFIHEAKAGSFGPYLSSSFTGKGMRIRGRCFNLETVAALFIFVICCGLVLCYSLFWSSPFIDISRIRMNVTSMQIGRTTINEPPHVNIFLNNIGDYVVEGLVHNQRLKFTDHELTVDEEDKIAREIYTLLPKPTKDGRQIFSNEPTSSVPWFSLPISEEEWRAVISGTQRMYLFVEMRYLYDGISMVTEWCRYVRQDYPSYHACQGHNQIYRDR